MFIFIYLFIYGCAGSSFAVCRLSLVAASRGYSLVAVRGLLIAVASVVAEQRLYSAQASVDSVIVVHGLSCPTTCEIFLDRGSNLCLLH